MEKNRNVRIIAMIGILSVFIIYLIYHYATKDTSFNKYKVDKSKNIVYSIYGNGDTSVPEINIKGAGVEAINTAIVDKANDFLNGRNTISYDFHINGKILSIAIKYVDYYDEVVKYPVITFDVYNINFYESKILSSNDMLSIYGVNEADVKEIVEGKFVDFYNDELEKGYFHDECDYACFLYQRGITDDNYMEDIYYYVKDGNLYVLKPFKVYSPFGEDKYYKDEDYYIQITDYK